NALKFTEPFGKVVVQTRTQINEPSHIIIEVKDSGIGIDEKLLPKIFDRFYQVGDTHAYKGGTGIGLAFANELVELHGGEIEVSSSPGKGTTFTFLLPRVQLNSTEPVAAPINESISAHNTHDSDLPALPHPPIFDASLHEHTVLVVEDNVEVRNFIAGML